MSTVTGIPDGWAFPNPVMFGDKSATGGMVWIGTRRMSHDDKAELRNVMGPSVMIDPRSVVGKYDIRWTTFYNYYTDNPVPSGGKGSECYELQHVGEIGNGVKFSKEPIFAYDPDNLSAGVQNSIPPNCGAYHPVVTSGEYIENYWGPEPESVAADMLGDREYTWDDQACLYRIKES